MAIVLGVLLIAIGLLICFRGICIASVFKAIFGALQGLVYAFAVQLILQMLRIVTGSWIYFICICIALILAYLAVKREELYHRIQGIVNALMIGALVAVVVYGLIYYSAFMYNGSQETATLATVAAAAIAIAFTAMGAKWYKFFRRVGTFVIVLIITAIILSMYIAFWPAILLALVIDIIAMYCLTTYEKYIVFLKIAAIGACVAVVGVWMLKDGTYMVGAMMDTLRRNIGRLVSGRTASSSYSTEMVLSSIGIAVLTIWGAVVQRRYYDSHLDEEGRFRADLSGFIGRRGEISERATGAASDSADQIRKVIRRRRRKFKKAFRRNKKRIKRICIGVIVASLVIAAGFGGVKLFKAISVSASRKAEEATIKSFANDHINRLNMLYSNATFTLQDINTVDPSADSGEPGYSISITGKINGSSLVLGWSEDGEWFTLMHDVYINNPYDCSIEQIAALYGSILQVYYNVDAESAALRIQQEMNDNPDWEGTELTFGAANNTYIWIGKSYDGEWMAEFGERF